MHLYFIWYFLIGGFLGNGMPHFIWGVSKTIARSPFAQKSKPIVNLRWGLANFFAATLLSLWQITQNSFTRGSLIALIIGFWVMILQFGLGMKHFIQPEPAK